MRIMFWDIETSLSIAGVFQLYDVQSIPYRHVIQEWFMISASWEYLDEKKSRQTVSVLDDPRRFKKDHTDDYHVVKSLYDAIKRADVLVAHNGNRFDWPKFEQKVLLHGLPPISQPFMVDTLVQARRFKFLSHKLDDLCARLDLERKMNLEQGLWIMATQGDEGAIKKIAKYNAQDIPPLKELYLTLRPYMKQHPNHNLFTDGKCCPRCGGKDLKRNGYAYLTTGVFPRFVCLDRDCRYNFRGKFSVKRPDFR